MELALACALPTAACPGAQSWKAEKKAGALIITFYYFLSLLLLKPA